MKELMIKYYVNRFGVLTLAELCEKNKDYSRAEVSKQAERTAALGTITRTETPHHLTGAMVVKYHSLKPVTRKIKPRGKKIVIEKLEQATIETNRLKRIISRRPGITRGQLMNSVKNIQEPVFDALETDREVVCVTEKHARTGTEYMRYYINYDLP